MSDTRGYYKNSLTAWKANLLRQRRQLMARYASMEKSGHPDKRDQGYLLEINEEMLGLVNRALVGLQWRVAAKAALDE